MPYIKKERRDAINPLTDMNSIKLCEINSAGELNYAIQLLVQAYEGSSSRLMSTWVEPNYAVFNAAIGAMEAAKLEYYRRRVVPYEDKKTTENGDVFPTIKTE